MKVHGRGFELIAELPRCSVCDGEAGTHVGDCPERVMAPEYEPLTTFDDDTDAIPTCRYFTPADGAGGELSVHFRYDRRFPYHHCANAEMVRQMGSTGCGYAAHQSQCPGYDPGEPRLVRQWRGPEPGRTAEVAELRVGFGVSVYRAQLITDQPDGAQLTTALGTFPAIGDADGACARALPGAKPTEPGTPPEPVSFIAQLVG